MERFPRTRTTVRSSVYVLTSLIIAGELWNYRMRPRFPESTTATPSAGTVVPSSTPVPDCYSSEGEPRYKGETPDATNFYLVGSDDSLTPPDYSCRFLDNNRTILDVVGKDTNGDRVVSDDERKLYINGTPFHPDSTTR